MILAAIALAPNLFVPAFTAYSEPNDEGIPISRAGAGPWKDTKQSLVWIGDLQCGNLSVELKGGLPNRYYTIQIGGDRETITGTRVAQFNIRRAGYRKITVKVDKFSELVDNGTIEGLQLTGSATICARFNLKERRNCASVHLKYPLAQDEQAEWFYNEVRPKSDPKYTYYEACGWHRGYFGIQVNSDHERRIKKPSTETKSAMTTASNCLKRARTSLRATLAMKVLVVTATWSTTGRPTMSIAS